MAEPATFALWAVLGYLLGSIPFGIVFARLFGLGDLRQIGSGNIGATNVLRTGNKLAAFLTLICDSGKGAAAVLIARGIAGENAALIAGAAAFVGHCFPIWLRFAGGKGVATYLGTMLALDWRVGLAACATWLAVALLTRYSSLSALIMALLCPLWWMIFTGNTQAAGVAAVLGAVLIYRHKENIRRLISGTESKIGKK